MAELKKKQYGFVTVFYEENDKGEKVIRKLRFLGEKKNEYVTDGNIILDDIMKPNEDGKVNRIEEIYALLQNLPEGANLKAIIDEMGLSEEDRQMLEDLSGDQLSDEEIENIYFPKSVTSITADESGEFVVLTLTGENVEADDAVIWTLTLDGVEEEIEGTGLSLTLDAEQSADFKAASVITVTVYDGGYESDPFPINRTAEAGAAEDEVEGGGTDLDDLDDAGYQEDNFNDD